MKTFITEFNAYKLLLKWCKLHNANIKGRFVYCSVKEKYFLLVGNRVNHLCKGCETIIKNF